MFAVCQNSKNVSPTKHTSLEIEIHGVSSDDQLADQFTKGICREKFEKAKFSLLRW